MFPRPLFPARWLLVLAATAGIAEAQTGTIVGRVVTREGGYPLPYGVIALPELDRELFTDDSGSFRFSGLKPGQLHIRVRRLGYAPFDATVPIRANAVDTVTISLDRIAVRLTQVDVREHPPCLAPGPPSIQKDTNLAAIYEQLQLNAQQLRTLSRQYPFAYMMTQRLWSTTPDGRTVEEGTMPLAMSSASTWKYKPGEVVAQMRVGRRRIRTLEFRVPTLLEIAEPSFVANHCFHYGGTVAGDDGEQLVQVDIVAAEKLEDPDVHGSMFLEANTFQIRRYVMRLSRMPKDNSVRGMTSFEVRARFTEVLPSIPVVDMIESEQRFDTRVKGVEILAAHEEQRTVAFRFTKGRPGQNP